MLHQKKHEKKHEINKNQPITAPTRKWGGCGLLKICASNEILYKLDKELLRKPHQRVAANRYGQGLRDLLFRFFLGRGLVWEKKNWGRLLGKATRKDYLRREGFGSFFRRGFEAVPRPEDFSNTDCF